MRRQISAIFFKKNLKKKILERLKNIARLQIIVIIQGRFWE